MAIVACPRPMPFVRLRPRHAAPASTEVARQAAAYRHDAVPLAAATDDACLASSRPSPVVYLARSCVFFLLPSFGRSKRQRQQKKYTWPNGPEGVDGTFGPVAASLSRHSTAKLNAFRGKKTMRPSSLFRTKVLRRLLESTFFLMLLLGSTNGRNVLSSLSVDTAKLRSSAGGAQNGKSESVESSRTKISRPWPPLAATNG